MPALRATRHNDYGYMAHLLVASTVFGYLAMSAKDIVNNRTPKEFSWKTFLASFLQGGGAGIYGDFLFADYTRYGHDLLDTLFGPTATTVSDATKMISNTIQGKPPGVKDFYRLTINNVPGANIWWSRGALNYLFGYAFIESIQPGYLATLQSNLKKNFGQDFIFDPNLIR
jgi:hypothetical protein